MTPILRSRLQRIRTYGALREFFHPDRRERIDAQKALRLIAVERAAYGEFLTNEDRLEMLVCLIKGIPAERRQAVLRQAGYSRGQLMQDLFVLSELGELRGRGFFVEFGATDGVALSNSWLLEKRLSWKGILAEPGRCWHEALCHNRGCAIETKCVWSCSGEYLSFDEVSSAELSTLSDFAQTDKHGQARSDFKRYQVPTISLNELMRRHDAPPEPDYLSIDTEGSEFAILSEFDFDRYPFKVITCEHNHSPIRDEIRGLLESKGYRRKHENLSQIDDWFVRAS